MGALAIGTGVIALLAGLGILRLAGARGRRDAVIVAAGFAAFLAGLLLSWRVLPGSAPGIRVIDPADVFPMLQLWASLASALAMLAVFVVGLLRQRRGP